MTGAAAAAGSANGSAGGWAVPGVRPPGRGRFRLAKRIVGVDRGGTRTRATRWRFLLLLERDGKRRSVLPGLLRTHVVPSNEEGDRFSVVNGLNGH